MHIFNACVYLGIRNGFVSLPDWNGTVVANFCEAPDTDSSLFHLDR